MKIKILLAVLLVVCACTACSDDKNEDAPLNQAVAGKYEGYTKAVAQYFPNGQYANTQSVILTANDDETVKVSYTSDSFGEFIVNNATIEQKDGSYTMKGEGTTVIGMGESKKEYAFTFEGNIDKAKETPVFVFTVPAVMGGMTITFAKGNVPESANN